MKMTSSKRRGRIRSYENIEKETISKPQLIPRQSDQDRLGSTPETEANTRHNRSNLVA